MTTDNDNIQELPDRPIHVLLSMDTYQGMSDSEIELIIEWKCEQARADALGSAELSAHEQAMSDIVAMNESCNQTITSMVQSILERSTNVPLGVVDYGQA